MPVYFIFGPVNKEGAGGLFERGRLLETGLLERGLTRKGGLLERGAK